MAWCRSTMKCQRSSTCRSRWTIRLWPRSTRTSTCAAVARCTTGRLRTRVPWPRLPGSLTGSTRGCRDGLRPLPCLWPRGTRWATTRRTRTRPTRSRWPSSQTATRRSSNSCTRRLSSGYSRSAVWPKSVCRTPKPRPVLARPTAAFTCSAAPAAIKYTTWTGKTNCGHPAFCRALGTWV